MTPVLVLTCSLLLPSALGLAGAAHPTAAQGNLTPLPSTSVSAGAAVLDGHLYVYGGHLGRAHDYHRESMSGSFARAPLAALSSWEALPSGPRRQGTALVAANGALLRIGGVEARNERGAEAELWSDASVEAWRPGDASWSAFAALPAPRSSHDAAVLDGRLYVAGGWSLQGAERTFAREAWSRALDRADASWERLAQPFTRRGLGVVAHAGALWCIGGMDRHGEQSNAVDVYVPATRRWEQRASLPGSAFGSSGASVGGQLLVTLGDGALVRWSDATASWSAVGSLALPRRFARVVALDAANFAVVGGTAGEHFASVERWPLAALDQRGARVCRAELAWSGDARQRMGLALAGHTLFAFGGNRWVEDHQFEPEDFSAAAAAIDLAALAARELPALPSARQSMQVLASADGANCTLYGGFGPGAGGAASTDEAWCLDVASATWARLEHGLPQPLTQFQVAAIGADTWLLGGLAFPAGSRAVPTPSSAVWHRGAPSAEFAGAPFELPGPRRAFACAVANGELYVVGGMADRFAAEASCFALDPQSGARRELPAPRLARVGADLVALDGALYLAGGSAAVGDGLVACTEVERLAPGAAQWEVALDAIPVPVPHARMLRHGDALLFVSASRAAGSLDLAIVRP